MIKLLTMGATFLFGIALLAAQPPADEERGGPHPPPPPPPRKEADEGPGGDLRRAYELLRRLRADGRPFGRPEERLKEWTERASKLYLDGVNAQKEGDEHRAHEYGAAAHDLARAVEHSKNASMYEGNDSDLPPPPEREPGSDAERVRADLWHAHDRIQDSGDAPHHEELDKFYIDAARDLYNAARRDLEAGRTARAGELAKASVVITHVAEHLSHALHDGPPPPRDGDRPEAKGEEVEKKRPPRDDDRPKAKRKEAEPKRRPFAPKTKARDFGAKRPPREADRPGDERRESLPPPL